MLGSSPGLLSEQCILVKNPISVAAGILSGKSCHLEYPGDHFLISNVLGDLGTADSVDFVVIPPYWALLYPYLHCSQGKFIR
jgi:hypothetical protein